MATRIRQLVRNSSQTILSQQSFSLAPFRSIHSLCSPNPFDVITGRGGGPNCHLGNRVCRGAMQRFKKTFDLKGCDVRRTIASAIVQQMQEQYGTRFLKQDEQEKGLLEAALRRHLGKDAKAPSNSKMYRPMSSEDARVKIEQKFREKKTPRQQLKIGNHMSHKDVNAHADELFEKTLAALSRHTTLQLAPIHDDADPSDNSPTDQHDPHARVETESWNRLETDQFIEFPNQADPMPVTDDEGSSISSSNVEYPMVTDDTMLPVDISDQFPTQQNDYNDAMGALSRTLKNVFDDDESSINKGGIFHHSQCKCKLPLKSLAFSPSVFQEAVGDEIFVDMSHNQMAELERELDVPSSQPTTIISQNDEQDVWHAVLESLASLR